MVTAIQKLSSILHDASGDQELEESDESCSGLRKSWLISDVRCLFQNRSYAAIRKMISGSYWFRSDRINEFYNFNLYHLSVFVRLFDLFSDFVTSDAD